jgi:hypothetical protein
VVATPSDVLAVPCAVCGVRAGLQCSPALGRGAFDASVWAHTARIEAAHSVDLTRWV